MPCIKANQALRVTLTHNVITIIYDHVIDAQVYKGPTPLTASIIYSLEQVFNR